MMFVMITITQICMLCSPVFNCSRKDFGVVIGTEKDDTVKLIKEGSEGPSVVNIKQRELKSASFDKKLFTVLDQHAKTISINDIVSDGPLKDRQGAVKEIYKGILFLCDESEPESNGYICVKAQLCEKVNISGDASKEKGSEPAVLSGFEDFPSSPNCPLSPNNSLQERENKNNLKYEHLSEVRGRNSAISQGDDSESFKPFNFLRSQDCSTDWMDGTAFSTDGEKWNAGGLSTERFYLYLMPESGPVGPSNSVDDVAGKGTEGSAWEIKAVPSQNSSWGAAAADEKMVANTGIVGSWGTSRGDRGGSNDAWNKIGASSENETGGWGNAGGKVDQPEASAWKKDTGVNTWKDASDSNENWGNIKKDSGVPGWGKGASSLDKALESQPEGTKENQEQSWGKAGSVGQTDSWSKPKPVGADGGTSWHNHDSKSWDKQDTSLWSMQDGGSSWNKQDGGSNGNKQDDGYSWGKTSSGGQTDSWSKSKPVGADGGTSWDNQNSKSRDKQDTSSWTKQDGGY
ncbi:Hypothetical predicted protein [Olea europaea subsp. europaea]|uniref:Spt5 KOW domain-containing protein n=1 Tax=Olea europaea subsp. europaea TaxID=158383 RepID=A0A8S0SX15_OLEEU|nr:Hypothetical predicted protein [Olea europaea subsp. europaea]